MESVLEVRNLSKAYGDIKAVNDINITVQRGEVFGLLGANGAGRSTVIECILGTRKQDAGMVNIFGKNPRTQRRELYERIGVQFQESTYQDKITVAELCEVTGSLYKNASDYWDLLK